MPFDGASPIDSVSASPSGSVQLSGTDTGAPAAVVRDTSSHAGARVTAMLTVAGADCAVPSLAR